MRGWGQSERFITMSASRAIFLGGGGEGGGASEIYPYENWGRKRF